MSSSNTTEARYAGGSHGERHSRGSDNRFIVWGGPGGYLNCLPAGRAPHSSRWIVLYKVNRPLTLARVAAAQRAVLRHFEVA